MCAGHEKLLAESGPAARLRGDRRPFLGGEPLSAGISSRFPFQGSGWPTSGVSAWVTPPGRPRHREIHKKKSDPTDRHSAPGRNTMVRGEGRPLLPVVPVRKTRAEGG